MISVTVKGVASADQITAFETIVPIDLSKIFLGHLGLPAVIGTKDETGAWNAAGQTRTVCLSDGSEAAERMDGYQHPNSFDYTVSNFTGILRFLAKSAKGKWKFTANSDAQTMIDWQYGFVPRSIFVWPIMWFVAKFLWVGYMRKALSESIKVANECNLTQSSSNA